MIYKINAPYHIQKFQYHEQLKNIILAKINELDVESVKYSDSEIISRSDWGSGLSHREYVDIIRPYISLHCAYSFEELGYSNNTIHNIWFQQYYKGSCHDWHVHLNSQWTNVYFLELPEDTPKTQFIDPITKEICEFKIEEGDILSFPSFIIHKAPEITTDSRKTIISFNSCANIG